MAVEALAAAVGAQALHGDHDPVELALAVEGVAATGAVAAAVVGVPAEVAVAVVPALPVAAAVVAAPPVMAPAGVG